MSRTDCRGSLSFLTNDETVASLIRDGSTGADLRSSPKTINDLGDASFIDLLHGIHEQAPVEIARVAFPAKEKREDEAENDDFPILS